MVERFNEVNEIGEIWKRNEDGSLTSVPGALVLDHHLNVYQLQMITTYGGGIRAVSDWMSAREMYQFLSGYSSGNVQLIMIASCKDNAEHDAKRHVK